MRTTDSIIQELLERRDGLLAADQPVDVGAFQQEITAHQQLARLRTDRAAAIAAKDFLRANDIAGQIQHWLRFVSVDVDVKAADDPKKDSQKLVVTPPADGAAVKA